MKKAIKYISWTFLVFILVYNSVYFKKLSGVRSAATASGFDAAGFSDKLWKNGLSAKLDSAVELNSLLALIRTNSDEAFSKYSNVLGIGNTRYFLVKAAGLVTEVNDDDVMIRVGSGDSLFTIKLATEFIYGNAVRDASGLVDISDFTNTADLNAISEQLNKKIRTELLPPFKAAVKKGSEIAVAGAIEINQAHINTRELEIIPARLTILQ